MTELEKLVGGIRLRGLGRKNEGPVNDLHFPGSADRYAGLLHPFSEKSQVKKSAGPQESNPEP